MADPNNIILHSHRLVFMCVPKVANTSVKVAFQRALRMPGNPHGVFQTISKSHIPDGFLVLAFVRDPIDRVVGCWRDKVSGNGRFLPSLQSLRIYQGMPFAEFAAIVCGTPDLIANQHFRSQTWELVKNGAIIPDFVGRFENIDSDWNEMRSRIEDHCGLELGSLPHENASKGEIPKMTENMRKALERRYMDDIKNFGYEAIVA